MLKKFSIVFPFIRLPWWVKLLLGRYPKPRLPSLSAFYRWTRR